MKESTSREKVLKSIRDALVNPMNPPFVAEDYADKIYQRPGEEYHEILFAQALAKVSGRFVYNRNENEFAANLKTFLQSRGKDSIHCYEPGLQKILNEHGLFCVNALEEFPECEISLTGCEFLVARTGSILVSSRQGSGRKGYSWPPLHVVVAYKSQLVYDIRDALRALQQKYKKEGLPSMVSLVTGPSRTADIEKTLVMGAHGPEELLVFFIDQ